MSDANKKMPSQPGNYEGIENKTHETPNVDFAIPGATAQEWEMFEPFKADMVPIYSNKATPISKRSSLDGGNRGKVPSRLNSNGEVIGLADWQIEGKVNIDRYRKPDYGFGVVCRKLKAIDVDINDAGEATKVVEAIQGWLRERGLPPAPLRRRSGNSRVLLVVNCPGELEKSVYNTDSGAVEILGDRQQFAACGTHPSGTRYEWDRSPGEAPPLAPEALAGLLGHLGAVTGVKSSSSASYDRPAGISDLKPDRVVEEMKRLGKVIKEVRPGEFWVDCPWGEEHSGTSGASSTVLYGEGHNGAAGGFKCQHAHCAKRGYNDLFTKLFKDELIDEFDELPDDDNNPETVDPVDFLTWALNRPPRSLEEMRVIPANDYYVDGLVITALAGALVAIGGVGKTKLLIQMACCGATGRDFLGMPIKTGGTVLLSIDDVQRDLDTALAMHIDAAGYDNDELRLIQQRVQLVSLKGAPFITAITTTGAGGVVTRSKMSKWLHRVLSQKTDLRCVIFDTMRQFAGGSPNDDQVITVLTQEVSALAEKLGIASLITHHMTKDGGRNGQSDQFSGTGSGAIADNLRFVLTLSRVTRDDMTKAVKLAEGEALPPGDGMADFLRLDDTRGSITRRALGSIYLVHRDGIFTRPGVNKTKDEKASDQFLTIMRMAAKGEGSMKHLQPVLGIRTTLIGPLVRTLVDKCLLTPASGSKPPLLTPAGVTWLAEEERKTAF